MTESAEQTFNRLRSEGDWIGAQKAGTVWGKERAAEKRATMTPEQRSEADALTADAGGRLQRLFVGDPNKKGRGDGIVLSETQFNQWKEQQ